MGLWICSILAYCWDLCVSVLSVSILQGGGVGLVFFPLLASVIGLFLWFGLGLGVGSVKDLDSDLGLYSGPDWDLDSGTGSDLGICYFKYCLVMRSLWRFSFSLLSFMQRASLTCLLRHVCSLLRISQPNRVFFQIFQWLGSQVVSEHVLFPSFLIHFPFDDWAIKFGFWVQQ